MHMNEDNNNLEDTEQYFHNFPLQLKEINLREIHAEIIDTDKDTNSEFKIIVVDKDKRNTRNIFFITLIIQAENIAGKNNQLFNLFIAIEGQFIAYNDTMQTDKERTDLFRKRDAPLILWPYLRETVSTITERMNLGMTYLPIICPNDFKFSNFVNEEEEE